MHPGTVVDVPGMEERTHGRRQCSSADFPASCSFARLLGLINNLESIVQGSSHALEVPLP